MSLKKGQARNKLIEDLKEQFGECADVSQTVEYLISSYVITPKALRDYEIVRYVQERPEGQSKKATMLDLEAMGCKGPANGLTHTQIFRICKNAE